MKIPINPQLGVGPPQHRWRSNWIDWLILPFYAVLSTSRDGLRTRPKLRTAHSAKFVLLWLLMGWVSVGYAQFVPDKDKDLIAYYPFDADLQDHSPSGKHHGSSSNINSVVWDKEVGRYVTQFRIQNREVNRFVKVPAHEELNLTDTSFTLSACIFQEKRNPWFAGTILSKRGTAKGWAFTVQGESGKKPAGHLKFRPHGTDNPVIRSNKTLSLNQWYHVLLTYDYNTQLANMYIDGTWDKGQTLAAPETPNGSKDLFIGRDGGLPAEHPHHWWGRLSEVSIYGRVLTSTEITELDEICHSGKETINPPPEPFHLLSPSDGFKLDSTKNSHFSWYGSKNLPEGEKVTYKLCRHEADSDEVTCVADTTSTSKTLSANTLKEGTTYEWWVIAQDAYGNVVPSEETWSFTTKSPPVVKLNSPRNDLKVNDKLDPDNITLEWTGHDPDDGDTVIYQVYVDGNPASGPGCKEKSSKQGDFKCQLIKPLIRHGEVYSWSVKATDKGELPKEGENFPTESQDWHFRIPKNKPPVADKPSHHEIVAPRSEFDNLTLGWKEYDLDEDYPLTSTVSLWLYNEIDGILQRQYLVQDIALPKCDDQLDCSKRELSHNYFATPISPDNSYFWEVKVTDNEGFKNEPVPRWHFVTPENQPPYRPIIIGPEEGSEISDYANFEFQWSWEGGGQPDPDENDVVNYEVYMSNNPLDLFDLSNQNPVSCLDKPSAKSGLASCRPELPEAILKSGDKHYWRVVANDIETNGEDGLSNSGYPSWFSTESFEVSFEVPFKEGIAPFTVEFTDTSVGADEWLWDFDIQKPDGSINETSSEQHPTFTYSEPGTYTVVLTATDKNSGQTKDSDDVIIIVNPLPEDVPLTVRPGNDTMYLDWSEGVIHPSDPNNTEVEFWRVSENDQDKPESWQLVDTKEYMDSSMSVNQYFDKNAIEPKMVKNERYCYQFKVFMVKGEQKNLQVQSEIACEVFGAVRIFISEIASAVPGNDVKIPVRISNAQGLQISGGKLKLAFDKDVIVVDNPEIDLTTIPSSALWDETLGIKGDFSYSIDPAPKYQDNANGRVVDFDIFGDDLELPSEIYGGQELFFWIHGKVRDNVANGTTAQFLWEPNGSSLDDVDPNKDIILSFGNAAFKVKKGNRLRDSKHQPVIDGYFTVDATGRLGDPNLNAWVDPDDGKLVLRHIADKSTYSFTKQQNAAADANGNGKIDANDATVIFYYSYYSEWPSLSNSDSETTPDDSPVVIKLDDLSGESGTEIGTTLSVENLNNFTGGEFILSYDPSVIEGISDVRRTSFTRRFSIISHDNGQGQVRITMAARDPINGSGALATLQVHLKSQQTVRKRTRDGAEATTGQSRSFIILAQVQLYDLYGRNFVTSRLQRTVERHNAEITRTDVIEDDDNDNSGSGGNDNTSMPNLPKLRGHILDMVGDPIVGATVHVSDQTIVTDETSYWEIVELAAGEYTITAEKDGYTFIPQTVTVADESLVVNLKVDDDPNIPSAFLHKANGYIIDFDNKPIAGVTVQVNDKTAVSDDSGYWRITDLKQGNYTLTAQKTGHEFTPREFTILNSDAVIQISSAGPYSANGVILDHFNQPVAGVVVKIDHHTAVTDANGYWQISGLFEKAYTVNVSKEGYSVISKDIEIGNKIVDAIVNPKLESLLDVKVTAEPRIAKQDENVTYTITVTNKGEETATGVVLSDVLPDGTDLVTFQALDGGNCSAETVSCTLPGLVPGATATVELILANSQAERLQNTATVMANEYPANVQVTWTEIIPYLSVSVTDTPDPIAMLSEVHYTVDVELSHYAASSATGVELEMNLPSGVKLESINTDAGICDTSRLPRVTCSLIDLSVDSAEAISHVTIGMDVILEDAGLLLLTSEAKVTANEYPAHTDRERTKIFIPEDIEVDIAFVIDVTGSMQEEINGVIKALKDFIAEIDPSEAPLMALVTFRDDVKVTAFTRDLNVLLGAVEKLKANGGGTCAEASVEALEIAIPHTKASGYILFTTDASPYPEANVEQVIESLLSKGIRINAMITGDCSMDNSWNELPNE